MSTASRGVRWRYIALYYAIAIVVAAPFNLGLADAWLKFHFAGTPLAWWPFLPAAFGPAIGALVARRLDTWTPRFMSVFGRSPLKNAITGLLPVAAMAPLGARAALLATVAVAYATLEELGWRGYLADALGAQNAWTRYVLTALLWWPWHLRYTTTFDLMIFPLIVLAASVGLGHAARTSRSVFVAGGMHALVILLTSAGAPSRAVLIAGVATVVGWILLDRFWRVPADASQFGDAGAR